MSSTKKSCRLHSSRHHGVTALGNSLTHVVSWVPGSDEAIGAAQVGQEVRTGPGFHGVTWVLGCDEVTDEVRERPGGVQLGRLELPTIHVGETAEQAPMPAVR
jgi:hypothetical protein